MGLSGSRAGDANGFTILELLVVMTIILVLATLAIPSFISQRTKADDAGAKSAARTAQTAEESYFTDRQAYTVLTSDLTAIEPTLASTTAVCSGGSGFANAPCHLTVGTPSGGSTSNSYTLSVISRTGIVYSITRTPSGVFTHTCDTTGSVGGSGGCHAADAYGYQW